MIVSCPSCTTAYQVGSAAIGLKGRSLRCHKCAHIWWQSPSPPVESIASKIVVGCPQCSREYSTDTFSVPPAGRNVRCNMCKHVWRMFPARPAATQAAPSIATRPSAVPASLPVVSPAARNVPPLPAPAPDLPAAPRPVSAPEVLATPIPAYAEATAADDGLPWPPYKPREQDEPQFGFSDKTAETARAVRRWPNRRLLAAGIAVMLIPLSGFALYRYLIEPRGLLTNPFTALNAPHVDLGVDLRDVTYTRQVAYGLGTVLTIHGKLANSSATKLPTPHAIQITLTDAKNAKLFQTAVKPTVPKLGPGESVAFTTTIYSAPEGAMHLQVTLVR